jgi:pimeloyl-ACP methyl ester carboxylesterase
MRWVRRILVGLLVLVGALAAVGFTYQHISERRDRARATPPGALVDVGGYRLHMLCAGSGSPAVILDAGLGGSSFEWQKVVASAATFTRVCAYDRAGQGFSDPGPAPRTSEQISREVSALLRATRTAPAIAVGASVGGWHMRVFASTHPEEVSGLVLVDASHEDQPLTAPPFARLVPIAGRLGVMRLLGIEIGRDYPATAFRAHRFAALYDELTAMPESVAQVKASRRELQIPVVVITAGQGTDPEWRAFQRDQKTLSRRSCQIVAGNSDHAIVLSEPGAVVRGIRSAWEAARSGGTPNCGDGALGPSASPMRTPEG